MIYNYIHVCTLSLGDIVEVMSAIFSLLLPRNGGTCVAVSMLASQHEDYDHSQHRCILVCHMVVSLLCPLTRHANKFPPKTDARKLKNQKKRPIGDIS